MKRYDACILGNAIIRAAVILASSVLLKGTEYLSTMITILGGGAGASLIIMGGCRPSK